MSGALVPAAPGKRLASIPGEVPHPAVTVYCDGPDPGGLCPQVTGLLCPTPGVAPAHPEAMSSTWHLTQAPPWGLATAEGTEAGADPGPAGDFGASLGAASGCVFSRPPISGQDLGCSRNCPSPVPACPSTTSRKVHLIPGTVLQEHSSAAP